MIQKAKDRATDLPDADLFDRVKEVTGFEEESAQDRGRGPRAPEPSGPGPGSLGPAERNEPARGDASASAR